MKLLQDVFPRTCALAGAAFPGRLPFDWNAWNLMPLGILWKMQARRALDLPKFWAWTAAMVEDLNASRATAGEGVKDAIDCARFITCIPALNTSRASGQLGDCFDWIWSALSATHVRGQRINSNDISFIDFPDAPRDLYRLYLLHVPQFAAACFYVSYKLGGLDDLGKILAPGCWKLSSSIHQDNPDDDDALGAMSQMVIWAAKQNWPDGEVWANELLAASERTSSARQHLEVAMTFTTAANVYVSGSPQEWAKRALAENSSAMGEHDRLQCLAVALEGPEDWLARRAEILDEISKLRDVYLSRPMTGVSDQEVLELRVWVIHPLIFVLVNWGAVNDVVDVLDAWYRAPGTEPANTDVLAVFPTHKGGAAYLWPGNRWLTGTGTTETYDALQRAASTALGSYFRGSDGDHDPNAYEDFRFDVVNAEAGHAFEAAMVTHYRFNELKERLPEGWTPRSTIVFPAGPEPLQAMLSKAAGIDSPLETSFQKARPGRAVRRISVWAGGPWHEVFELQAIEHIANRNGWVLAVHQETSPTREDLQRFYEDEAADVLWVISHGTHDPFSVRKTGLHLPDESLVDLEELRRWKTPELDRRLLVLNSCSGASAQGRGGLARIGLAQSLASDRQSVVGHLWPIHWTAGLAFGAVLIASLEIEQSSSAAITASAIMREPERMVAFLEERFAGCDELLNRLRRSDEDMTSMTNWGCAVLLT